MAPQVPIIPHHHDLNSFAATYNPSWSQKAPESDMISAAHASALVVNVDLPETVVPHKAKRRRKRHAPPGPAGVWYQSQIHTDGNDRNGNHSKHANKRHAAKKNDGAALASDVVSSSPAWMCMQRSRNLCTPYLPPYLSIPERYSLLRPHFPTNYLLLPELHSGQADLRMNHEQQQQQVLLVLVHAVHFCHSYWTVELRDECGASIQAWMEPTPLESPLEEWVKMGHVWLLQNVSLLVSDKGERWLLLSHSNLAHIWTPQQAAKEFTDTDYLEWMQQRSNLNVDIVNGTHTSASTPSDPHPVDATTEATATINKRRITLQIEDEGNSDADVTIEPVHRRREQMERDDEKEAEDESLPDDFGSARITSLHPAQPWASRERPSNSNTVAVEPTTTTTVAVQVMASPNSRSPTAQRPNPYAVSRPRVTPSVTIDQVSIHLDQGQPVATAAATNVFSKFTADTTICRLPRPVSSQHKHPPNHQQSAGRPMVTTAMEESAEPRQLPSTPSHTSIVSDNSAHSLPPNTVQKSRYTKAFKETMGSESLSKLDQAMLSTLACSSHVKQVESDPSTVVMNNPLSLYSAKVATTATNPTPCETTLASATNNKSNKGSSSSTELSMTQQNEKTSSPTLPWSLWGAAVDTSMLDMFDDEGDNDGLSQLVVPAIPCHRSSDCDSHVNQDSNPTIHGSALDRPATSLFDIGTLQNMNMDDLLEDEDNDDD